MDAHTATISTQIHEMGGLAILVLLQTTEGKLLIIGVLSVMQRLKTGATGVTTGITGLKLLTATVVIAEIILQLAAAAAVTETRAGIICRQILLQTRTVTEVTQQWVVAMEKTTIIVNRL